MRDTEPFLPAPTEMLVTPEEGVLKRFVFSTPSGEPSTFQKWFAEMAEAEAAIPPCKFCGHVFLVGMCCEKRRKSISKYWNVECLAPGESKRHAQTVRAYRQFSQALAYAQSLQKRHPTHQVSLRYGQRYWNNMLRAKRVKV